MVNPSTAGLILAGGQARRLGGQDKGLVALAGRPLIEHVLERLRPQVATVVINANRNLETYQRYGHPVLADTFGEFAGPLAGMLTAMTQVAEPWLAVVPCDGPLLPNDLVSRLHQAVTTAKADIAVAHDGSRLQPVVALIRCSLAGDLRHFLEQGGRKIDLWYSRHDWVPADFADCAQIFRNINTPEELAALEQHPTFRYPVPPHPGAGSAPPAGLGPEPDHAPTTLTADQARAQILRACEPAMTEERIALAGAHQRILAQDLLAPRDVPPHDHSAMDGYALRHADLAATDQSSLNVIGKALAGHPFPGELTPGNCVRIMTGATLPPGADTVAMQEDVREDAGQAVFSPPPALGANIRRRGEDLRSGAPMLSRGRRLNAADLGLLASMGVAEIPVLPRPRVCFFSTGDELRPVGTVLQPGEIYESNRYTLGALLTHLPVAAADDLGNLPDQPEAVFAALSEAGRRYDVVLTTGGVSVGEADHIKQVLAQAGSVDFWKIAIKPGRPLAFGRLAGGAWFFGLPGNPVAVVITFLQFVRPALQRLAGQDVTEPLTLRLQSRDALRKRPGRTEFQWARLLRQPDGQLAVALSGGQGSGMLTSLSRADCLIILHHDQGAVAPGDWVDVQLLPDW